MITHFKFQLDVVDIGSNLDIFNFQGKRSKRNDLSLPSTRRLPYLCLPVGFVIINSEKYKCLTKYLRGFI